MFREQFTPFVKLLFPDESLLSTSVPQDFSRVESDECPGSTEKERTSFRGLCYSDEPLMIKEMSSLLALSTLPWHSMVVSVKCCSLLAQRHRSSFIVALTTGRQQARLHRGPLPPTCGFMTSARIASPCFLRSRCRAFHKSPPNECDRHAPPSRGSHDVVNVGPSTPHLSSSPFAPMIIMPDVFDDSVMNSSRVVCQLHLGQVEQSFLERFETDRRVVTCAESVTMAALRCNASFALPIQPCGRTPLVQLNQQLLVCAAPRRTTSRATDTHTHLPNHR